MLEKHDKIVETVSWDVLRERGQIIEHTTPNNIIGNVICKVCGSDFTCSVDLENHKKAKCFLIQEQKTWWRKSKKNTCEWISAEKVPHVVKSIREGHRIIDGQEHWLYGNDQFVARKPHILK